MKNNITFVQPKDPGQYEQYFLLRYQILRQPWNQPPGSERDEMEDQCIHGMLVNDNNQVIAVARLQDNGQGQGQIRYMAVADQCQSKGVGSRILKEMEDLAKQHGFHEIVLQARENAIPFYLRNNYEIIDKTFLLWGQIQHYLMRKSFKHSY